MRSALFVAVVLVGLFVAVPVMTRVRDVAGPEVVGLLALAFGALACWLGHSDESAAVAEDFRAALRDVGMSQKEAAIAMGIPETVLAKQLYGKEHLSLWRAASLGRDFRVAFAKRQLARDGECVVIERGELCDLVNAVQVMTAERRRPLAFQHAEVA